jgi:hypothetical protein
MLRKLIFYSEFPVTHRNSLAEDLFSLMTAYFLNSLELAGCSGIRIRFLVNFSIALKFSFTTSK